LLSTLYKRFIVKSGLFWDLMASRPQSVKSRIKKGLDLLKNFLGINNPAPNYYPPSVSGIVPARRIFDKGARSQTRPEFA